MFCKSLLIDRFLGYLQYYSKNLRRQLSYYSHCTSVLYLELFFCIEHIGSPQSENSLYTDIVHLFQSIHHPKTPAHRLDIQKFYLQHMMDKCDFHQESKDSIFFAKLDNANPHTLDITCVVLKLMRITISTLCFVLFVVAQQPVQTTILPIYPYPRIFSIISASTGLPIKLRQDLRW